MQGNIPINDYHYELPEDRIAAFPLEERDKTKLLVYNNGLINDHHFYEFKNYLPPKSLLVFNNTKVIRARLLFHKPGGAKIEIFCLNEIESGPGYARWKCYIGNAKRWKKDALELPMLTAHKEAASGDSYLVLFKWHDLEKSFDDMLEAYGKVPLPPYIHREPVAEDTYRYQTVYAKYDGSVAAPTAGLHFTEKLMNEISEAGHLIEYLTLHVGAGTFKPVISDNATEHQMHEEKVIVNIELIRRLIDNLNATIIPVGTTSMRTLESLYWFGLQLINGDETPFREGHFYIDQWEPYRAKGNIHAAESLTAIYDFMKRNRFHEIQGYTRIMIVPGYRFRICHAIVTNFHQPQSTLLLLVAAFIGDDWKNVYNHALTNDYRFLSYGDGCLFFRQKEVS